MAFAAQREPATPAPATAGASASAKAILALTTFFSKATGAIESLFAPEPVNSAPLLIPTPTPANGIGIVRHAPSLNGNGRVEGSLRQLTGESVVLNGGGVITNDLQVPGIPTLLLNGSATFGGTIQGTGSAQPTNYQVTLNGTSTTTLGHLVTRTNPISLTNVAAPPASSGTRSVTITASGQSAGNFATLRDLTLNGNVGMYSVPAGTYRNFIANAGSGFILGVSGATQAAVYNMNTLTLNGSAQFQVIGPVVLTLGNGLTVNAAMGVSSNPAWLKLQIASGGLTLNSGSLLNAVVNAPASTVIINASSSLVGTLICDRLTINGGGLPRLTESAVNHAPTVNAGGNQTIALPSVANLNGSASDDGLPIGSTLKTTWTKVSGPGTVTFANANSAVTTATFGQAGTYVVRLTASDSQLSNFSEATITVLPQNLAPSVSAGPDRTITQPGSATLNGSASDDGLPAGSSLSLLWTKVSGPGTVTFTSPNAAVTNASFSAPGAYTLRLTASDSQLSNFDQVDVTVNAQNQAPNVNASADQNITLPSAAILHGTVTDDGLPSGSGVTVAWSKLSGPGTVTFTSPNNVNTNASFSVAGNYTLQLTASDTALSNHDEVDVHVAAQNHAPTVSAGTNQTITLPASANLNGSVSDDGLPAGSTVTTTWSKVSGPGTVTFGNANVTVTTATFSAAGSYVLRLTASDSDLSDHADVTIAVIAQNHAPTVNAGNNQTITLPANANLNGSASDDGLPAGSTLTTTWIKVSGPGTVTFGNANATATTATFSDSGSYVLRLTASDSDLSNNAEVQITIIAENHAPTADAGTDQTITLPNTANLNGSASDDGLPAGSTLTTVWTKVSGPGTVTFGNPNVTVTTAAFGEAGPYVLRLTASDSALSASATLTVTVMSQLHPPVADFITTGNAGVSPITILESSSTNPSFPVANLFDNDGNTHWRSTTNAITDQVIKLQLTDTRFPVLDHLRLQSSEGPNNLKDFEVLVSKTDADDASFSSVLTATLANNGDLQEFVLPAGPTPARYVKLIARNNWGGDHIALAAFEPIGTGSVENIVSLLGQNNLALNQSPALFANGGTIFDFSPNDPGTLSPTLILNYATNQGAWSARVTGDQHATIRLAGGKLYTLRGVRVMPWADFTSEVYLKDFEAWVSATTPDPAAFTKVLTAAAVPGTDLQEFLFPAGSVQARYVKFVPLTNYGNQPSRIMTKVFDVIVDAPGTASWVSSTLSYEPDGHIYLTDGNTVTGWHSAYGQTSAQWVKVALRDRAVHKIYGVRITPDNSVFDKYGPKDFDLQVSTTTEDDTSFSTVLTGTLTDSTQAQEFSLPDLIPARYVKFVWHNGYGNNFIGVHEVEVLGVPAQGSVLLGSSDVSSSFETAAKALNLDSSTQRWVTPAGQVTNQWLKLMMPGGELTNIDHVALQPGWLSSSLPPSGSSPRDFDVQVSITNSADASFATVCSGTLDSSNTLQHFYFPVTEARYVRLLIKTTTATTGLLLRRFLSIRPILKVSTPGSSISHRTVTGRSFLTTGTLVTARQAQTAIRRTFTRSPVFIP